MSLGQSPISSYKSKICTASITNLCPKGRTKRSFVKALPYKSKICKRFVRLRPKSQTPKSISKSYTNLCPLKSKILLGQRNLRF